jgi:predicted ATPase/class 3 adenylate cyclase
MGVGAPSGTVTFLFTDIEGSTRLWQVDETAMRSALERHDAILRAAIDGHGGYVFSTGGDGFGVAFARAGDAVAVAVEAQTTLAAQPWPEGAPIRVRMGMHTGEVAERDGDYFGTAVNRAARLMATGHGGQILVSAATAGVLDADVGLVDLGGHRLRDLDRPLQVFQVGEGRFAPLRSLDSFPGNLPVQVTSFVGRYQELAAVTKGFGSAHLVTLTGTGGIGKSRLALQVAAELLPGFADGAWLCELTPAVSSDEMAQVVAIALGVVQRQAMTMAESIVDFLRPRSLLVVLDNCEHLLDAAAELAELILAGAPGVRILATSQEGLGIPGEHVWPLRSLSVAADAAGAMASDAVALFAERAQAVSPGFVLDDARTPGVVEVCRRLDGIPLAIELAAARVAGMTPAEIAAHLDDRFRLLAGGRRGRVRRHQTLQAAVEWSYSLLADTERALFDRLGVFPGSFDEAAAVAVCATEGIERWDVIASLASLVAKSMVGADPTGDTTRYQFLETLRHFSLDQTRADGTIEALRRLHAAHYAAFAERAGAGLITSDELAWRGRVAAELDNLRAAAAWAFEAANLDDLTLGIRMVDGLAPAVATLIDTGMYELAFSILPRVDELGAAQRCVVLNAAAHAALHNSDDDQAAALGARVLAESDSVTSASVGSLAMVGLASVAGGDTAVTTTVMADAHRFLERGGASDWHTAGLHSLIGFLANSVGDHQTARSAAEQNLAIARRAGTPTMMANALDNHAVTIAGQDPQGAIAAAEEAMRFVESGANDTSYNGAHIAALLLADRGETARAARTIRGAAEHHARLGQRTLLAGSLRVAIVVLAATPPGRDAAATLVGAINGPILNHFTGFPHDRGKRYDEAVAALVTALARDDYATAQQRGAAMTYDEIVAYTHAQLDRLAESSSAPDR